MGTACLISACSLESGCAIASSTVAIAVKGYEFNKNRQRRKNTNKVLLPPLKKKNEKDA